MESLYLDDDKRALRRSLRHQRRALSEHEQRLAAQRLCQRLKTLPEIRRARRLSLYLPVNGEIDPTPLIPWLRQRNVNIYLPVLRPFSANRLWFVAYRPDTPMIKKPFWYLGA
jgi:5-formyltetrahydrofolate cyclo-ligase